MIEYLVNSRVRRAVAVLAATFFAIGAQSGLADENHTLPASGQFYISPGVVVYEGPGSRDFGYDDIETGGGLILGYSFNDHWALEVLAGRVEADFTNSFGRGEDDIDLTWLNVLYKLDAGEDWQPFVLFGGGRADYNFDGVRDDDDENVINAGVGLFREVTERIAIRADVRAVRSGEDSGISPMAFLGVTGFLGEGAGPRAPADSDGDGVPNDRDRCPTTPPGRTVDADGCEVPAERDSDGDGVMDGDDRCPNTPAGVQVDADGCALDTDGDGVPDHRDACPDTEAGARVDERGCYVELEEEVTIDMSLEFDTDSAAIRDDHLPELGRAVNFLRQYPTANAVIEGHTDSDGAAAYNQALSERRAKAVYDYMINEADIDAGRLSYAGFGESQPIAGNDTAEGKQRNRRVSAVVTGMRRVRQ